MSLCKHAVLEVDQRSGFNLLQAAVFEGHYDTVVTTGIFVNEFLREMTLEPTVNNARIFAHETPDGLLTTFDEQVHCNIKTFYEQEVEKVDTLTDLHRCGDNDDAEMVVELVLHNGMNVNIVAKGNRTPLLWASSRCSGVFLKTLIDLGADTNAQRQDQCTSLILATYWNNYMAAYLLIQAGVKTFDSTLHIAAMKGFANIAKILIEAGCGVDLQSSNGKAALHLAVQNKHKHVVQLLIENNADVNSRDKYDPKDKLYLVRGTKRGKTVWNYVEVKRVLTGLFHKRVKAGRIHLASFGTVLASGWGESPPDSKREEVRAIVDAQVTTEVEDKTALHYVCDVDDVEIIEILLKHGADSNACDTDGFTPLQLAAIHGNMQVVKKLVELKVDVNLTTADGKDAADCAQLNEESDIEEFLKSKANRIRKLWNKLIRKVLAM